MTKVNDEAHITERQKQLLRWWSLSLDAFGDAPYKPIRDHANATLVDVRLVEAAIDRLTMRLHTCKAVTPAQFRAWCYAQIDKEAARLVTNEKPKRSNTKRFNCYERDGICCIPVLDAEGEEHTWKVSRDWIDDIRDRIWPVHIAWYSNGKPFLARKRSVKWPGGRKQVTLPAHHIYLWFKYPGISEGDIACSRARDGDFLNWTGDNIYVPAFDGLSVSEAIRSIRLREQIEESSGKWVRNGKSWARVSVGIDPELIEQWERKLQRERGDRDITEVGIKVGQADIVETQERLKAFDPRRIWKTPSRECDSVTA